MTLPLPCTVAQVDAELHRLARYRRLYRPEIVVAFKAADDKRIDELLDQRLALTRPHPELEETP